MESPPAVREADEISISKSQLPQSSTSRRAAASGHTRIAPSSERRLIRPQATLNTGIGLIADVLGREHPDAFQICSFISSSRTTELLNRSHQIPKIAPGKVERAKLLDTIFPSQEEVLDYADAGYLSCFRLHETISRSEFQVGVGVLYNLAVNQDNFLYYDWVLLVAAVLALALALDAERHNTFGCSNAMSQSLFYLDIVQHNCDLVNGTLQSITQLRVATLITLLKMSIDNPAAAYDHLALLCSTATRLGITERYSYSTTTQRDEDTPMQNLFWTILFLDGHICGMLNKEPFLDDAGTGSATLVVMQHAAKNAARIVRSSQGLLLNVGLALQIELVKIQRRIANLPSYESLGDTSITTLEQIRHFRKDLDDFKVISESIFPFGEVVNVVARTGYELLMGYCITMILLSTRRLGPSKLNDFMTNDEAELAGLRTTAAIRAIDLTTEYAKLPDYSPFSEPAAYVLFLSTLCLIMSDESNNDTQALLKDKIQVAFLLMNRIACPMHAASSVYIHYMMKFGNIHNPNPYNSNILARSTVGTPATIGTSPPLSQTNIEEEFASLPILHSHSHPLPQTEWKSGLSAWHNLLPRPSLSSTPSSNEPSRSAPFSPLDASSATPPTSVSEISSRTSMPPPLAWEGAKRMR